MKFHHIGIATEDILALIDKLKNVMDVKHVSEIVYDELQDANLCMITLNDGTSLELISGNVVANLVKKRNYLYHLCFSVKSVEESLNSLMKLGAIQISDIKPAILFEGKKVVFVSWNLGIMELVEK